ncbi:MAG: hypothetical protein LBR86_06720 [Tannerella sp.]|jgi:hypothetical protein|nr:hypothetical protein [Tannerella sp.]
MFINQAIQKYVFYGNQRQTKYGKNELIHPPEIIGLIDSLFWTTFNVITPNRLSRFIPTFAIGMLKEIGRKTSDIEHETKDKDESK